MKKKADKRVIYPAAFLLLVAISFIYSVFFRGRGDRLSIDTGNKPEEETTEAEAVRGSEQNDTVNEPSEDITIQVYICGEVNEPGVYTLHRGDILYDAVNMAGGLTPQAASDRIDLVYILNENISVYIPSEAEIEEGELPEGDVYGVAAILTGNAGGSSGNGEGWSEDRPVNINTASREELMTLPGIGEVTADAIIEYRQEHQFADIREIMNVSGIGEGRFDRISGLICV